MDKRYRKLMLIVLLIIVLSVIGSMIVRTTWFRITDDQLVYIGLAAPLSGPNAGIGQSMERGAALFLESYQDMDRAFRLIALDDQGNPQGAEAIARQLAQESEAIAAITFMSADLARAAEPHYRPSDLPIFNISSLEPAVIAEHDWLKPMVIDAGRQAGFTANYVRNVLGHKIVTLIHADTAAGREMQHQFTSVYARFGTRIHYTYEFEQARQEASLTEIVADIKDKKDLGVIFFAGDGAASAHFVVQARNAGIRNTIVGTDIMASNGFRHAVAELIADVSALPDYTDSTLIAVPLLFDTAGGATQRFRDQYIERYGSPPDWIAAYAYEAARLAVRGVIEHLPDRREQRVAAHRAAVNAYIDTLSHEHQAVHGVAGQIWFPSADTRDFGVVQIGVYNGEQIIAAPTQLQAIRSGSAVNYFDELKSGRMLFVNDRFMYKTNVIYTGIELHHITELDILGERQAELDFSIWFRYSGAFDPADIEFLNAVDIIRLGEPVEKIDRRGTSFRRYRVQALFKLDFLETRQPFGRYVAGLAFHHRTLNRNNVIYVVDVLGMEFDTRGTLRQQLQQRRALDPASGWRLDQAWLSQRSFVTSTLGSPIYVGYGTADPNFSRIDYGMVLSEDRFDFRALVDEEYLIYIGIFGLIGSLAAWLMDRRLKGLFWQVSSWVLRVVFWPLLLLSVGNLTINGAIRHEVGIHHIHQMIMVYNMLWWFVPATLLIIAVERFFWVPLEARTGRKVPNLIRKFIAALIYLFALCGVVAFVLGQTLTSLLATSGLFAMIVGLAIQGNIANVFSGIVLNLERPFSVGDWITIRDHKSVKVVDMTWRTVRLENAMNHVISIPNGSVSDAPLINYSSRNYVDIDLFVYVSPKYDPVEIKKHIETALAKVEGLDEVQEPFVVFMGVKSVAASWAAEYMILLSVPDWGKRLRFRFRAWEGLLREFNALGISLDLAEERQAPVEAQVAALAAG